jgi:uncharacterized protein YecA (UPF0149 family)
MPLDRGTLARIDRRVFTQLKHSDGSQVVKVPVSDAVWSTSRRYCDALEMTMGQAVAGLITHELATVVDEASEGVVFDLDQASQDRADRLNAREQELGNQVALLHQAEELLMEREERLRRKVAETAGARVVSKVGRNEPCPCGSGFKYKLCHGILRDKRGELT